MKVRVKAVFVVEVDEELLAGRRHEECARDAVSDVLGSLDERNDIEFERFETVSEEG